MITEDILVALWILVGAAAANMTPVFVAKAPLLRDWKAPLDFGLKFRGKPLMGRNKTWRGLICGTIVAVIVVALQQALLRALDTDININGADFTELPTVLFGALLGSGALIGDAVESFFKRQYGITPGDKWPPFDQIDFLIGASLFTYAVAPLTAVQYIFLLIIGFVGHLIASYIGFKVNLKDTPL